MKREAYSEAKEHMLEALEMASTEATRRNVERNLRLLEDKNSMQHQAAEKGSPLLYFLHDEVLLKKKTADNLTRIFCSNGPTQQQVVEPCSRKFGNDKPLVILKQPDGINIQKMSVGVLHQEPVQ